MIFFVLSGFLIGGRIIEHITENKFDVWVYLVNRLTRLYIVLILIPPLNYALDSIGLNYLNESGLYDNSHQLDFSAMQYSPEQRLEVPILLSNFVMLQTILSPTLGTNGPLWSLANEFWYYLLFPVIVLFLVGSGGRWPKVGLAILIITFVIFLPWSILRYFSVWVVGALLVLIKRPIFSNVFVPLLMVFAVLAGIRFELLPGFPGDFLLGFTFALSVNALVANQAPTSPPVKRFNKILAGFSYSLYVSHFPALIFILALLTTRYDALLLQQPNAKQLGLFLATLIVLYAYGYLVARLTEHNTARVRRIFLRRVFWSTGSWSKRPAGLP